MLVMVHGFEYLKFISISIQLGIKSLVYVMCFGLTENSCEGK